MKNPFTPKLFGRVLLLAAIGAMVTACATYFVNLYSNSWHYALLGHKLAWVELIETWNEMCMDQLRSWGFGYPKSIGMYYLLTSIANALLAFLYLLVPGFLWQLFRSYEHDHKIVA